MVFPLLNAAFLIFSTDFCLEVSVGGKPASKTVIRLMEELMHHLGSIKIL